MGRGRGRPKTQQTPESLKRDADMFVARASGLRLRVIAERFHCSRRLVMDCINRERYRRDPDAFNRRFDPVVTPVAAPATKPTPKPTVAFVSKTPVVLPTLTITLRPDIDIDTIAALTAQLMSDTSVLHVGMPKGWLSMVSRLRMSPLSAHSKLEGV